MAHVTEIDVLDKDEVARQVATIDALIALVGEVQASPTTNTLLDRLKVISTAITSGNALLTTQAGYLDGIEALIGTTNTSLTTIAGYVDGLETLLGPVTETAPASDTASSGLNGRLQRIAQNLTTAMSRAVAQLGARTVAQSPAINIATDDPIAKKIGTRAYTWASAIARTVGSSSAATSAVGTAGEYEISTDTDCYVAVGSAPTASATAGRFMGAGSAWTIQLSSTDKVAVIRKSADGNLYVLPVA